MLERDTDTMRPRINRTALAWALALVSLAGCSNDDPVAPVPTGSVSFTSDVQPIFNARCAVSGCHVQPSPQAGCDLSAGQSYTNLVNIPAQVLGPGLRVAPGDPENSVLYLLVESGVMPATGNDLQPADVALIRKWIEDGAKND